MPRQLHTRGDVGNGMVAMNLSDYTNVNNLDGTNAEDIAIPTGAPWDGKAKLVLVQPAGGDCYVREGANATINSGDITNGTANPPIRNGGGRLIYIGPEVTKLSVIGATASSVVTSEWYLA